jgi:hypothetical protein
MLKLKEDLNMNGAIEIKEKVTCKNISSNFMSRFKI